MNTHQKVFFTGAVAFGLVAAALASSPAPVQTKVPAAAHVMAPEITLERTTIIGHRLAPEITLERTLVLGHRSDLMVASRSSSKSAG